MKFDVKNAFFYEDIDKGINFKQLQDCIDKKKPTHVLKLLRSLYGLKRILRCWNKNFVEFLKKFIFKSFEGEKCVFVGEINGALVYLAICFDDGFRFSAMCFFGYHNNCIAILS